MFHKLEIRSGGFVVARRGDVGAGSTAARPPRTSGGGQGVGLGMATNERSSSSEAGMHRPWLPPNKSRTQDRGGDLEMPSGGFRCRPVEAMWGVGPCTPTPRPNRWVVGAPTPWRTRVVFCLIAEIVLHIPSWWESGIRKDRGLLTPLPECSHHQLNTTSIRNERKD